MTSVCVAIMVEDVDDALAGAALARDLGADLIEYRVDALFHGEDDDEGREAVLRLARESPLACVVTCRSADEGGAYDGDDSARISLYEALGASDHPPAYIDVEASTLSRSANLRQKVRLAVAHDRQPRDVTTRLILSTHDFDGRPADLVRALAAMREEDAARVLKIAYRARSLRDNLELFELLEQRDRPTIALGMGEYGLMSRVLAPKFGGFLTFASLRNSSATAPGQPTIVELMTRYRFRSIDRETEVFGVVGWPVGHSISPHVHNAAFEAVGRNAVYLPMSVGPAWEHFKATVLAMLDDERLDLRGLSVTLPHKEHLVRLADEQGWLMDEASRLAGAANTLVVDADGPKVLNTDGMGIVRPLEESLDSLAEREVVVIGTGGAARSAAAALAAAGAMVRVAGRNTDKAQRVASAVNGAMGDQRVSGGGLDEIGGWSPAAVVHCTPVGMAGGERPDECLVSEGAMRAWLDRGMRPVMFDTVYTPRRTPLVACAEGCDLPVISGLRMFVEQAAGQYAAWSEGEVPRALMLRVAEESLTPDAAN